MNRLNPSIHLARIRMLLRFAPSKNQKSKNMQRTSVVHSQPSNRSNADCAHA